MTKFADQLFDDLMREHGPALAPTGPAPTGPLVHTQAPSGRHLTARRTLLASGGTLAVAGAIAGTLVAGGGTPAYAVTKNPDGTITLAVYQQSGIAQANTRLRQLGDDQLVVVPVRADCPKPPPPAVSARGGRIITQFSVSRDGSVTVHAQGIPAGDILVVGMQISGHNRNAVAIVTSPPAPSCISPPAPPPGNGGSEARLSASRNQHDVIRVWLFRSECPGAGAGGAGGVRPGLAGGSGNDMDATSMSPGQHGCGIHVAGCGGCRGAGRAGGVRGAGGAGGVTGDSSPA